MDNLPLAVTQAAAYLRETGLTTQGYLQLLTDPGQRDHGTGVPAIYPVSLAASLQLAFDQLDADDPAALALLQLAPEPIPYTLLPPTRTYYPHCLQRQLVTRWPSG